MDDIKFYTSSEERANVVTHLAGLVMGLLAAIQMFPVVFALSDWGMIVGFFLMFIGLFGSYGASVIYHHAKDPKRKKALRFWDHAMIYVSIAGYYSPMLLGTLRSVGAWGWSLMGVLWLGALTGIVLNTKTMQKTNHLKTASYILMGWVVLIALKPLIDVLSAQNRIEVLYWLLIEGLFYTMGAVIYAKAKREYIHAVFHVFVCLGTFSHLMAMWCLIR